MRKALIISLIIIAAILGYALWRDVAGSEVRLVAFGDSLTYGTGSAQGGGYVTDLEKDLGISIENLGVPGDTTADALQRLDAALAAEPDVVILLLGGNDYLQGVPLQETAAHLSEIIEGFQAAGARVLLLGITAGPGDATGRAFFAALAEKHKVAYVPDVLAGVSGVPALMSDLLHPNDAGYALVAQKVEPELRKLLR
jgi:acyl-CoA thioesterase-1